ncbi:MAG: DUF3081 family protein [Pseudomonadales bacterium]
MTEMREKIDVRRALQVFNFILEHGQKGENVYRYNGLNAASAVDGYTISLYNDYVRLDILFHNRFTLDYSNEKELEQFCEKIDAIATALRS